MRVLLTGGAGYLGSVLLPKLLRRKHEVRVIDVGFFGFGHMARMLPGIELVREDLRRVNNDTEFTDRLLEGVDVVIHLAAMSNDPSAELEPGLTREVNTTTTVNLAKAAKKVGAKFIFSSSCSVYGACDELITETSACAPLTTYAQSKLEAEKQLLQLEDKKWKPVILRNGTLFGYSPRMRFDLVINVFSLFSALHDEIKVFGDGKQWRPFLHVADCAKAFIFFAEKTTPIKHTIYNIANENLTVEDVAKIFSTLQPKLKINRAGNASEDTRNYRVNNSRMKEEGFHPQISAALGAEELQDALIRGAIEDPESILYQNVKWLKQLGISSSRVPVRRFAA